MRKMNGTYAWNLSLKKWVNGALNNPIPKMSDADELYLFGTIMFLRICMGNFSDKGVWSDPVLCLLHLQKLDLIASIYSA